MNKTQNLIQKRGMFGWLMQRFFQPARFGDQVVVHEQLPVGPNFICELFHRFDLSEMRRMRDVAYLKTVAGHIAIVSAVRLQKRQRTKSNRSLINSELHRFFSDGRESCPQIS